MDSGYLDWSILRVASDTRAFAILTLTGTLFSSIIEKMAFRYCLFLYSAITLLPDMNLIPTIHASLICQYKNHKMNVFCAFYRPPTPILKLHHRLHPWNPS
jgi:hypothetical protein